MSPHVIAQNIADEMGVSMDQIKGASRKTHLVECRRMIALILNDKGFSVYVIAEVINRDRSTVVNQIEVVRSFLGIYRDVKKQYENLMKAINETQTH